MELFECTVRSDTDDIVPQLRLKQPERMESYTIESFRTSELSTFRKADVRLNSFSMLTFNAGLLELKILGLGVYQNPPFTHKRVKHIPNSLREANADFVALQEVYSAEHAKFIIKELIDIYPYAARDDYLPNEQIASLFPEKKVVVKKSTRMGVTMLHSGLLFLSKYPIIAAKFHPWNEITYLEAIFANKGFLEILVSIPTIGQVAFYNMHMASASINPESRQVEELRLSEVKQLLAVTEETVNKGFFPIIVGDLNAAPTTCTSNYTYFTERGWTDSYIVARKRVKTKKTEYTQEVFESNTEICLESPGPVESFSIDNLFYSHSSLGDISGPLGSMKSIHLSSPYSPIRSSASFHKRDKKCFGCWSACFRRKKDSQWQNIATESISDRVEKRGRRISFRRVRFQKFNTTDGINLVTRKQRIFKRLMTKLTAKTQVDLVDCEDITKGYKLRSSGVFKVRRGSGSLISPDDQNIAENTAEYAVSKNIFVISNKQRPYGRTKKLHWWSLRKRVKEYTWDPENPLNKIGPHSGCSGLRCDYIFLPPASIAGPLFDYVPMTSEILFRDPTVMINRNGPSCGCLLSVFSNYDRVMLVTLSDHYALKIVMSLKDKFPI